MIEVRVYFEDTDFTGVVFHANYLKYFERGRSDGLRSAGFNHASLLERDDPLAFTVRSINVTFYQPARIDDLLSVETVMISARGARMIFHQFVRRNDDLLAEATVEVASMNLSGKPRRIPQSVLAACPPTPLAS